MNVGILDVVNFCLKHFPLLEVLLDRVVPLCLFRGRARGEAEGDDLLEPVVPGRRQLDGVRVIAVVIPRHIPGVGRNAVPLEAVPELLSGPDLEARHCCVLTMKRRYIVR